MESPVAVRADLERYSQRLMDGCHKAVFSEVHMALMKAKSWLDYEEATPIESGYWLGILTAASNFSKHRETVELLRRYARDLKEQLKPTARAAPPK